ncbi:lipid-A-disaccharide synthase [Myxococcaceae bacterium]|jgi:lipid-A-disaccharide synthase|nr:lipid-A-disaccharide synthase [Myxococcaceae bacterium]
MTTVLVCAGDASGDLLATGFVAALRERRPDLRFVGLGGDGCEKAGVEIVVGQRELAIGGFIEVVPSLRRIVGAWRRLGVAVREHRPSLAVLVDSPDFNLPFARRLRRAGVPVLYYVSPQVWAWRRGRVRKLARRVDAMAAIFPFEPAVYAGTPLRVEFVGHPLVEPLAALASRFDRSAARAALSLPVEGDFVALLPGSRRNELRHHLGLFLASAAALVRERPATSFVLALAPSLGRDDLDRVLAAEPEAHRVPLHVVSGRSHEVMLAADAILAKPGTVSVEAMLLERPLVVAARTSAFSAWLTRRLVEVPTLTMANLIADAPVVPEFLQEQATPEAIAGALAALLEGPAARVQRERLAPVRASLGRGGAARRAAAMALEMLDARR